MLRNFGVTELLVILVIVILVFGAGKLTGVGKALGTAIREFKDSVTGESNKDEKKDPEQKK